ncbi:MAG: M3 family metallopeptidase, partial [Acidiferrobacterales bacterium]|nr:M3 family metallopeptidase [Acidiferrobacterales bacterium]
MLDQSGLPRFSEICPEHVLPALEQVLGENRAVRERLLKANATYTWNNFVQPLEDMDERLARMWSPVAHLNAVKNSLALREAYNAGLPRISDYHTELAQDERVYRAYKQIAAAPTYAELDRAQRKIIDNALRDFRLSGVELAPTAKRRFREIQQRLALLGSRFTDNVLDATQGWELVITDERQLAGLPESARAMAHQAAERDGKRGWKFTLDGPSYVAFMTYADNRPLRARMYEAYVTRASEQGPHAGRWDNSAIMVEILQLRREAARLLGFATYAEYSLQRKMVKNPERVIKFLRELAARAKPVAERELEELRTFARKQYAEEALEAWDILYYSEKLRQQLYHFSQEDLRPYFPVERVIDGMFAVVSRLYGLRFEKIEDADTWDPDVRFYELRDAQGDVRGRFYLDLCARQHKRGGAWMDECINRKRTPEGVQVPVAHIVCNASPPIGDRPSLFNHAEIVTLFHEFGHGLHHLLTKVDYVGVAGINGVAWDAVELPSQFMENWCWEREALDLLARHYRSGEPMPQNLYGKLIKTRNFQAGMQMVRQLEFGLFDMRLHSDHDPDAGKSIQALLDEVRREVAVVIPPPYNRFQNSFSHIFAGGYAAGYYSYKWAEVLSADAFSKFEKQGIFDRETGQAF